MKKIVKNLFLFLPFIFLFEIWGQGQTINVKVVGVVDGDTFTVRKSDKSQRLVRIMGIDAPEKEQHLGIEAKKMLASLISNKKVKLKFTPNDQNDEILAKVFLGGKDVGLKMLRSGFAWCEPNELADGKDEETYCSSEKEARGSTLGIWRENSPLPPWEFRRNNVPREKIPTPSLNSIAKFQGQVTEIIDGIGIGLNLADNSHKMICISRLEIPEPGQPGADISEQHLKDLILGKNVTVIVTGLPEGADCYFGEVYLNGINVNLQMVRDGAAWANKEYYYPEGSEIYEKAEKDARSERRGIWQDPNPMPPWVYRNFAYRVSDPTLLGDLDPNVPKTVRVRSYKKRDGTFVRSYTRGVPGSTSGKIKN